MRKPFLNILVLLIISFVSCKQEKVEIFPEIHTGILKGHTGIFMGNFPGPPTPISITVAVTKHSEFFQMTLLVDSTVSAEDGSFEMELPVGTYNLFLKDNNVFVCSGWLYNGGHKCEPFKIGADSVTNINPFLDHADW
jgi:hypothetical protein